MTQTQVMHDPDSVMHDPDSVMHDPDSGDAACLEELFCATVIMSLKEAIADHPWVQATTATRYV